MLRSRISAAAIAALGLALGAFGAGCADTASDAVDLAPLDDKAAGARLVRQRCASCHDPGDGSMSGSTTPLAGTTVYPANLTTDEASGIGAWNDAELGRAIRQGIDDEGAPLCPAMPRFTLLTDTELRQIIAYLRSLPPVSKDIPESVCPPVKGGDDDGGPGDDAVFGGDDGGAPDLAMTAPDLAQGADLSSGKDAGAADLSTVKDAAGTDLSTVKDAGATDLARPADGGSDGGTTTCHPVVNELQTWSSLAAADEFIELYNPCTTSIDMTGAKLVYRSAAGTTDLILLQFTGKMPAGSFFLCGGLDYAGTADATYTATSMSAKGGGVALRDARGALMDAVGWGTATNAFVRGTPATAPDAGRSIGRIPDGKDTGDNSKDFPVTSAPTPDKPNK